MITYGEEHVTLQTGAPTVNTIGVSLGRIVRFCGHTRHYYTVLCHSLVVADLLPPEIAIYGLMHDAQESLVSDVPTPFKTQVARNRESVLLRNIYIANGLPWPIPENVQDQIDEADHKALIAEAHILKHPGAAAQWGYYHDELAGEQTKKYRKRVKDFLDPDVSGPYFERRFNKLYKDAGLDQDQWV
jgi:5'-deoxynucleotidase YfbR-like HD superfamily hydrolase